MHAKQYIDTVMMNIQKQLGDEQIFPTKFGQYNISTSLVKFINQSLYTSILYVFVHSLSSIHLCISIYCLFIFY